MRPPDWIAVSTPRSRIALATAKATGAKASFCASKMAAVASARSAPRGASAPHGKGDRGFGAVVFGAAPWGAAPFGSGEPVAGDLSAMTRFALLGGELGALLSHSWLLTEGSLLERVDAGISQEGLPAEKVAHREVALGGTSEQRQRP